jgi:hypothetical protein
VAVKDEPAPDAVDIVECNARVLPKSR